MSRQVYLEPQHPKAMGEHEFEPQPGLPGRLPEGENVLWQGLPDWRSFAIHAFHARKVAIYCVVLMVWHFIGRLYDGYSLGMALSALFWPVVLTIAVTVLLTGLAWLSARSTLYTITNRRVVIRSGIAIPLSINIPFKSLSEGNLKQHRDGTGDIILKIAGRDRIAYLHLWPHARRWRFSRPEPMLRCIPDPVRAAEVLGSAINPELPPELIPVDAPAARQDATTTMRKGSRTGDLAALAR